MRFYKKNAIVFLIFIVMGLVGCTTDSPEPPSFSNPRPPLIHDDPFTNHVPIVVTNQLIIQEQKR